MPDIKTIHLNGVESLDEKQKQLMNRLLNEYYVRIFRIVKSKDLASFEGHIKAYEKEGKAHKFSFNIKMDTPAGVFKADAVDWDFARVIHKALNKLMNEIEGKLHSSDQHDKVRYRQKRMARK